MSNAIDTDWTQERADLLIRLRTDGMKRGAIAEEINRVTGSKFTRSAVCGKIDRLFPAAKPVKTAEERAESLRLRRERGKLKKRKVRAANRAAQGNAPKPVREQTARLAPALAVVAINPSDFPGARVHGLDALETHHCRFICNDDLREPIFCGLPILAHSNFSWCSGHHAVLTQKPLKTWGAKAA